MNMPITSQELIAFAIVAAAVCYVGYRIVRWLNRKGPACCDCCQRHSAKTDEQKIVRLDENAKP